MPQVIPEAFPLQGGLDLVSPALALQPGNMIGALNFEPDINGGYRRMFGCERYDGRPRPSEAQFTVMTCTGVDTVTLTVGATVYGATATAVVLAINSTTEIVVNKVVGTFSTTESLHITSPAGTVVGTYISSALNTASTPQLQATYASASADNYRADIQKPAGSGAVRGTWYYNGKMYCFRDNAGGTAANMFVAMPTTTATVLLPLASPGVVTWTSHGFASGQGVIFTNSGGTLPTGLTAGVTYYVLYVDANTFQVSATVGGAAINFTVAQSGTHTGTTVPGWNQIVLGTEVQFTAGNLFVPVDNETLTQGGVTAKVRRVLTRTGTWAGTAAGTFVIDTLAGGNFAAGAATLSGGATVTLSGIQTAITLQPGGRFEFANYNFSGSTTTQRMYFVDGKNYLSEFDGVYFVPIRTGAATDTPKFLAPWKNYMVVAIASSIQISGIGTPYSWTALTGASEIALGDICTGLLPQLGNSTTSAMAVYTSTKTFVLYLNAGAVFSLVTQAPDAGAANYTVQNIGFGYSLDTKGVVSMQTTLNFGNFIMSTLTRKVQPIIDQHRGLAVASCIVRSTNQYRLFYSDGTGLILYFSGADEGGNPVMSVCPFDYTQVTAARTFNTVVSFVDTTGVERIFASGNDGYVYELDRGTSHDGDSILAYAFLAFNSSKTPRNRKRYKRTVLQATCQGTASITVGYEFNFGSTESDSGVRSPQTLIGNGGYWDIFTWDSFNWDAPYVNEYKMDTPGDGINMGLVIYGDSKLDLPYTVHSAIIHYTVGRLER